MKRPSKEALEAFEEWLLAEHEDIQGSLERLIGKVQAHIEALANEEPPRGAFLVIADSEYCGACGKHIRRHYGRTEYWCDPRSEPIADRLASLGYEDPPEHAMTVGRLAGLKDHDG